MKRIKVSPCLEMGGWASAGISGSQLRLMSAMMRRRYGSKSTPWVSERMSTPPPRGLEGLALNSVPLPPWPRAALLRALWMLSPGVLGPVLKLGRLEGCGAGASGTAGAGLRGKGVGAEGKGGGAALVGAGVVGLGSAAGGAGAAGAGAAAARFIAWRRFMVWLSILGGDLGASFGGCRNTGMLSCVSSWLFIASAGLMSWGACQRTRGP